VSLEASGLLKKFQIGRLSAVFLHLISGQQFTSVNPLAEQHSGRDFHLLDQLAETT
jgi:hypothetical protein